MKAVTWQGKRDVRVEDVADPIIKEPTDIVVRVTTTGICGSDLHLYEVLGPFMTPGDVLGHEPMGIVEEVGADGHPRAGRRPGGDARSRSPAATATCATPGCRPSARRRRSASRVAAPRCSATAACTGPSRAARPSSCGCPQAAEHGDQGPGGAAGRAVRLPVRRAPDRLAGRGVRGHSRRRHASSCSASGRSATWPAHRRAPRAPGHRRRPRPRPAGPGAPRGNEVLDSAPSVTAWRRRPRTHRRARPGLGDRRRRHGGAAAAPGSSPTTRPDCSPTPWPRKVMQTAGTDRLTALRAAIDIVRRGGTISLSRRVRRHGRPAADAGAVRQADPAAHGSGQCPALGAADHAAAHRRGSARRRTFATHRVSLADAPAAYERFQRKLDGTVKVLINP